MNKLILFTFILFLTSCGIDKESAPPLASVSNTGELDVTFDNDGYLTIDASAGGSMADDEIHDMVADSIGRIIAVGTSTNGSGNKDMTVWRLNASGAIDTSFASSGVFVHDNAAGGSGDDIGYSVTIDESDNIYVAGTSLNGSGNFDMVVWKMDSGGTLDSSFSGNGVFVHDNAAGGSLQDQGNSIALDSTLRVVVAGYSDQTGTNRDMAVWKITTAGVLDTSFDTDGVFTDDGSAGGEDDVANAVAIDSSNNIIVAGNADSASNGDMAVWKISATGTLDSSFSGDGFFSQNGAAGGNDADSVNDLVIDSEGNYLMTGFSRNSDGNFDMQVWKLTTSGSLDTSFNSDGMISFDVSSITGGATNDTGEAINFDSEGRIVISGSGNDDMCIWRYNTNGTIDSNFNTDGFFSHDSAAGGFDIDISTSFAEDSQDRLYIGGFSENSDGNYDATFWRLK